MPGGPPAHPRLFLGQTEAQRAEKGLDPPLSYVKHSMPTEFLQSQELVLCILDLLACSAGVLWVGKTLFVFVILL